VLVLWDGARERFVGALGRAIAPRRHCALVAAAT
jgi:hypothetical protein